MLVDLTLQVDGTLMNRGTQRGAIGHWGTHIDLCDAEFPLDHVMKRGIVFDVARASGRDIDVDDVALPLVQKEMFVVFASGFSARTEYASKLYYDEHPQLSKRLIDTLLDFKVAMIGVDFAGIRRGAEHAPTDQRCADQGVFIVENLCRLHDLLRGADYAHFDAYVFPMNFTGLTGLPCRVVGKIEKNDFSK